MLMLRSCFAQKHLHWARSVHPQLFGQVAPELDQTVQDVALALLREGADSPTDPLNRREHARAMLFRTVARGGLGIPSAQLISRGAYTAALLCSLPIWRKLANDHPAIGHNMSIGGIPRALLAGDTLTAAQLRQLTTPVPGSDAAGDPLAFLSPERWGEWARMAGTDRHAAPRDEVQAVRLAQDRKAGARQEEEEEPDTLDLVRSPAERVVALALRGAIPRSIQHMLTGITASQGGRAAVRRGADGPRLIRPGVATGGAFRGG
jgi:hypothetical protein